MPKASKDDSRLSADGKSYTDGTGAHRCVTCFQLVRMQPIPQDDEAAAIAIRVGIELLAERDDLRRQLEELKAKLR